MGCVGSKIIQHGDDLFNEEHKLKRHLTIGAHLDKGPEGIEGNVQCGCTGNGFKKFALVKKVSQKEIIEEEERKKILK